MDVPAFHGATLTNCYTPHPAPATGTLRECRGRRILRVLPARKGFGMFYQPSLRDHGLRHDPFKALVVPRPIGWISSLDPMGRPNLAPYSFFNAMASDPPVVVFGTSLRPRSPER